MKDIKLTLMVRELLLIFLLGIQILTSNLCVEP